VSTNEAEAVETESSGSDTSPSKEMLHTDDPEDNWPPLSRHIFRDWGAFLQLGIPGALSLFFEWGSFEAVAGIAGQLGPVGLATHGIFMSTSAFFYRFPSAIAAATASIAGKYLGENDARNAKFIIWLGIWVDFAWGIGAGSFLVFVLRPYWGSVYTDVEEVRAMVASALPNLLFYLTVDSTKCITLNILRSTGRPFVLSFYTVHVLL
jgi:MATE family multidrug resistance protein